MLLLQSQMAEKNHLIYTHFDSYYLVFLYTKRGLSQLFFMYERFTALPENL